MHMLRGWNDVGLHLTHVNPYVNLSCCRTMDSSWPFQVHYVQDAELAYVMQRYRECHDLYHCVVNLPVAVEYELAVKFFEFANLGLPVAGFAAAFGHLPISSKKRARLFNDYVPWAIKCGIFASFSR